MGRSGNRPPFFFALPSERERGRNDETIMAAVPPAPTGSRRAPPDRIGPCQAQSRRALRPRVHPVPSMLTASAIADGLMPPPGSSICSMWQHAPIRPIAGARPGGHRQAGPYGTPAPEWRAGTRPRAKGSRRRHPHKGDAHRRRRFGSIGLHGQDGFPRGMMEGPAGKRQNRSASTLGRHFGQRFRQPFRHQRVAQRLHAAQFDHQAKLTT